MELESLWSKCAGCNKWTSLADEIEGTVDNLMATFCLECIQKDPDLPPELHEKATRGIKLMRARRALFARGQQRLAEEAFGEQ